MARITVKATGEEREVRCEVDGIDILGDVLGGCGVEAGEGGWIVDDEDDADWWERWAGREERIAAAYEEASDEERQAYEEAIEGWGHDYEALQDAQEVALGLAGYEVTVSAADEAVDETRLLERYATEAEALQRLEEIEADEDWREQGLEAWAWEITDLGGMRASIAGGAL